MKKVEKYIIMILSVITVAAIGTAVYFGINSSKIQSDDNKIVDTNKDDVNNLEQLQEDNIEKEFITELDKTKLININSVKKRDLNKIEEESQIVITEKELTEIISYSYNYKDYKEQILIGNFKINSDGSITLQKFLVNDISYDEEYNIVNYKKICDVSTEEIRLENDNKAVAIYGVYYEPADVLMLYLITDEGYIYTSDLNYDTKSINFKKYGNYSYNNLVLIYPPMLDAYDGTGDGFPFAFYGQTNDNNYELILNEKEKVTYKEAFPHSDAAFGLLAIYKDYTFKILNDTDFIKYNSRKLMLDRAFTNFYSKEDCIYIIDSENYLYKLSYEYGTDGVTNYKIDRHNESKIRNIYFNKENDESSDGSEYEYINNIYVEYENNKIEKFSTDSFETYNFGEEN